MKADIGLIGLAVMGENLALNIESRGFSVAVYNRTVEKVDRFLEGRGKGKRFVGCRSPEQLCENLASPRKILLMVKAGAPVDALIDRLLPLLDPGDVLIDGGNSFFLDTERRVHRLAEAGVHFVGMGVSGGEEGALHGPALMPGGAEAAWPLIRPVFEAVAARTPDGEPCCRWIGPGGAGHFVKMVHNGIEYGDMQLIAETYHILKTFLGLDNDRMADIFKEWNRGELSSYLIEITRDILRHREPDGRYTLDIILDAAGQKGTGKWTVSAALDRGQPLTLIAEAVFARFLSALKEERVEAARRLAGPRPAPFSGDEDAFIDDLRGALYAAKIVSYAQGYQLLRAAAERYRWPLDYGGIALVWRGGCIIRSAFLDRIKEAFTAEPDLVNLLLAPFFRDAVARAQEGWRRIVAATVRAGIPLPALSSALAYYDGYRSATLPANLIQAQRDYFGAHTYERIDRPRGEFFHTDWTGHGGATSASTYNA